MPQLRLVVRPLRLACYGNRGRTFAVYIVGLALKWCINTAPGCVCLQSALITSYRISHFKPVRLTFWRTPSTSKKVLKNSAEQEVCAALFICSGCLYTASAGRLMCAGDTVLEPGAHQTRLDAERCPNYGECRSLRVAQS